jgi:hypothetical protein
MHLHRVLLKKDFKSYCARTVMFLGEKDSMVFARTLEKICSFIEWGANCRRIGSRAQGAVHSVLGGRSTNRSDRR